MVVANYAAAALQAEAILSIPISQTTEYFSAVYLYKMASFSYNLLNHLGRRPATAPLAPVPDRELLRRGRPDGAAHAPDDVDVRHIFPVPVDEVENDVRQIGHERHVFLTCGSKLAAYFVDVQANDTRGWPVDVFAFEWMRKIVARSYVVGYADVSRVDRRPT